MHWVISEPVDEDDSDDSAPGNISNFPLSEQSSLFCLACTQQGYSELQGKDASRRLTFSVKMCVFLPISKGGFEAFTHSSCVQLCLLA